MENHHANGKVHDFYGHGFNSKLFGLAANQAGDLQEETALLLDLHQEKRQHTAVVGGPFWGKPGFTPNWGFLKMGGCHGIWGTFEDLETRDASQHCNEAGHG